MKSKPENNVKEVFMGVSRNCKDKTKQNYGYKDHFWILRFWTGMCADSWIPLLLRNRFAISVNRLVIALLLSFISFINLFLSLLQKVFYGRRIERTEIQDDPVFVIGHWRSGTTLLHELLALDRRHTFADTYACFAPSHFLFSGWFIRPWLKVLLPARRPMDNMTVSFDLPQEDELALCNLGVRSPYLTMAFPNHPPQDQEYLDLRGVPPEDLARWKRKLIWFLKCVTLRSRKRIVLKSPPHTCRMRTLLAMFPRAKFVHIVRDPHVIFPSTINLWKRLYSDEGLQKPDYEGLEEHVFQTFTRMYEAFDRDRDLPGPGQFCEVRYEDLVAEPLEQMRRIYKRLELGEFEAVTPAIRAYFEKHRNYRTNRYQNTPEIHDQITRRWSKYLKDYGYAKQEIDRRPPAIGGRQASAGV